MKKTISAVLALCILTGLLSALTGCSGSYPFEKGASVEQNLKANQSAAVGGLGKTGWQLQIPEDTFSEDGKLTMKVFSETETQSFQSGDFTFYGTPVEISLNGKEHTALGAPVAVTLQIPKKHLKDLAAEELFFASFYDGQWEYLLPNSINHDKGTATVEIYHFSLWGFGKPSEAKQIETYANNLAAARWAAENRKNKLKDALSRQYDDLFASIGITSTSSRNQFTADMISYLENATAESGGVAPIDALAQMANAASKGEAGKQEFQNKLLEYTAKCLTATLEQIHGAKPGDYTEKIGSSINIIGNLSSALGSISGGDNQAALESVASLLKGVHPAVALTSAALDFVKDGMENAVDIWSLGELEKGYQVYIGNAAGKWGADSGFDGSIDDIFITMGGGARAFNINVVKKYCEKYGMNESELSQADRDRIIDNAKTALKRQFDERKSSEAGIAAIQKKEEAFIAALKDAGLLSAYSHEKFFGLKNGGKFDVTDRLTKLYELRKLVLGYVDDGKIAGLTDKQIATLIDQWITWSEKKDRSKFFKYLRGSGYNEEPVALDPAFAWVLADTVNYDRKTEIAKANQDRAGTYSYSASAAPGSYSYTWTYVGEGDTYYDPDLLQGETSTSNCTWTVPPSTIQGGETVTLSLKLSFGAQTLSYYTDKATAGADFDKWDVEPGEVTGGAIPFQNKDGKSSFTIDTYKTVKVYSVSETVTAVAPTGSKVGDKIALRTTFSGSQQGTCYIYEWKQVS